MESLTPVSLKALREESPSYTRFIRDCNRQPTRPIAFISWGDSDLKAVYMQDITDHTITQDVTGNARLAVNP